ncbi:MAG: hypothetical protein ACNS64_12425 [Candidatus Halalkalibacterium sp. M3_1C_030]
MLTNTNFMAEKLEEVISEVEERDYATSLQEMEDGLPVFGRITGTTDDLKQFDKELPFNFRQPFNVVKAIFRMQPGLYTLHTGTDYQYQFAFRIEPLAGEQVDVNEHQRYGVDKQGSNHNSTDYQQHRVLRLEGELHDADRKIRQLVDEIVGLKRELSEDKTATLLTHQKELADQKESHRNEIDRLKEIHRQELKDLEKQIGELEKVKFRMEMEQRAGGRDAGSRMLDMLEENAPMFFTVISQLFAGQGGPRIAGAIPPGSVLDISEEDAKAMAETLKKEMQTGGHRSSQPNAHLSDEANQDQDSGEGTPHHLPAGTEADESETEGGTSEETLNGRFVDPRVNGHHEPTMSV